MANVKYGKASNRGNKQAIKSAQGEASNQQIDQVAEMEISEINDGGVLVTVDIPKGEDHLDNNLEDSKSDQEGPPEKQNIAKNVNSRNNNAMMANDSEAESILAEELASAGSVTQPQPEPSRIQEGGKCNEPMIALKNLDKYIWANADLISRALQHQAASNNPVNNFSGTKDGALQPVVNQTTTCRSNPQRTEVEKSKQDHFQS